MPLVFLTRCEKPGRVETRRLYSGGTGEYDSAPGVSARASDVAPSPQDETRAIFGLWSASKVLALTSPKQLFESNAKAKTMAIEASRQIPLEKLVHSKVQNPSRHKPSAIKLLAADMEARGQLADIHVQAIGNGMFRIAEGHRRTEAARMLGWKYITAKVHDPRESASDLWARANGMTRSVKGADWLYGWATLAQSDDEAAARDYLAIMPKHTAQHIMGCVKLFGRARAVEIGLAGDVSPVMQSFARLAHAYMAQRLKGGMALSEKDVAEWMLEHGMEIRKLLGMRPPTALLRKLHTRMANNQPFPRGDWE